MKFILAFLLLSSVSLYYTPIYGNIIIKSPLITNNGTWGKWEKCDYGTSVQAMKLLTEPDNGFLGGDDTATNAIGLYCGDPNQSSIKFVTSLIGPFGKWGKVFSCRSDKNCSLPPDGYVTGFQLRVEPISGFGETATNNVRIICTYPDGTEQTVEGDGLTYGSWNASNIQRCLSHQRVCAFQVQVQPDQHFFGDDTALNNVNMECCDQ